jgi:glucan phosphoethanolaminetransferase (alkaline phosphatase superfamily)
MKATGGSPSKPPAEERYDFAVYGLRNWYTRTSDLMRDAMNGLYVYSIIVDGSLLALVIWISRRYDAPLYEQAEIAFLFGAFILWAVIMTGLYSPFQSSVFLAQQNGNPALAATPSDNRAFLEKFSIHRKILDNNHLSLRWHTRLRKAAFLIMSERSHRVRCSA